MTDETEFSGRELEFDLADRMRKALRVSGLHVQDMADFLGVTRGTVSTWINGHIAPSTQTVLLWSLRTRVPLEWLQYGPRGAKGNFEDDA